MQNQTKTIDILRAARAGDKTAEQEIIAKLTVRFSSLVTCQLQKYPVLTKWIDIEDKSQKICQDALAKIRKLCPPGSSRWKLARAVSVLQNVLDDFITNSLTDLAKQGDAEAENLLFFIIREKLVEQIDRTRWRAPQSDYQDK